MLLKDKVIFFSHYSICDENKELCNDHLINSTLIRCYSDVLAKRLVEQKTHWQHYYARRHLSTNIQVQVLIIINDKMDHAKTTFVHYEQNQFYWASYALASGCD